MERFPSEFAELLSARGRHVLAGTDPLCGALGSDRPPFLAAADLVDPVRAQGAPALLEH